MGRVLFIHPVLGLLTGLFSADQPVETIRTMICPHSSPVLSLPQSSLIFVTLIHSTYILCYIILFQRRKI